jgi:hypothetical protein
MKSANLPSGTLPETVEIAADITVHLARRRGEQ